MSGRTLVSYGGDRTLYIPESLTSKFRLGEVFSNKLATLIKAQQLYLRERALEFLKVYKDKTDDFPWLYMGIPISPASALHMISMYPENLNQLSLMPDDDSGWFSGTKELSEATKKTSNLLSCSEIAEMASRVLMLGSRMMQDEAPKSQKAYHALYLINSGQHHHEQSGLHLAITLTEYASDRNLKTQCTVEIELFFCEKTAVPAGALGQIFTKENLPPLREKAFHPSDLTKFVIKTQSVQETYVPIVTKSMSYVLSEGKRDSVERVASLPLFVMEELSRGANSMIEGLQL